MMTGRRRSFFEKWAPTHNMSVDGAAREFPEEAGISRYGQPEETAELLAFAFGGLMRTPSILATDFRLVRRKWSSPSHGFHATNSKSSSDRMIWSIYQQRTSRISFAVTHEGDVGSEISPVSEMARLDVTKKISSKMLVRYSGLLHCRSLASPVLHLRNRCAVFLLSSHFTNVVEIHAGGFDTEEPGNHRSQQKRDDEAVEQHPCPDRRQQNRE